MKGIDYFDFLIYYDTENNRFRYVRDLYKNYYPDRLFWPLNIK